jgi:hypothetical protein
VRKRVRAAGEVHAPDPGNALACEGGQRCLLALEGSGPGREREGVVAAQRLGVGQLQPGL